MEHRANHVLQVGGVNRWDLGIAALEDFLAQAVHILGLKGRGEGAQFVEHAAKTPYVAFNVVGFVLPDFGAGVVGSAGLGGEEASLGHLGHVHVAQLEQSALVHEQICTLNVSVDDVELVERLEPSHHLHEVVPDLGLGD